jgi:hypothetical protein
LFATIGIIEAHRTPGLALRGVQPLARLHYLGHLDKMTSKPVLALVVALILFTAVNVVSSELFPAVWGDEVMFTDPAANLALDGNFVSTAWPDEPDSRTWAANAPLYSLVLAAWIRLLGLSITSVRSFNLFLVFGASLIFLKAARRGGLLQLNSSAVIAAVVALFDYGVAFNYRAGRYDCMGMVLVAAAAYGASREWSLRLLLVFAACVAMPAAGLQVALYMGIVFFLALIVFGRAAVPTVAAGVCGLVAGAALLLGTLVQQGVLDVFLSTAGRLRTIADGSWPKDPSFWLVLLATIVQMARSGQQAWWRQRELSFLASVGVFAPLLIYAGGRFPTYYTWMSVLPLSALLFTLIERSKTRANLIGSGVVAGLVTIACLLGLPLQLASGMFYGHARSYEEVRRLVGPIGATDVVVYDSSAYYAVRPAASKIYLVEYVLDGKWMNDEQRRRVNIMVVRREQFQAISERLGGGWQSSGKSPPAESELPFFRRKFGDKLVAVYDLQVFRRVQDGS